MKMLRNLIGVAAIALIFTTTGLNAQIYPAAHFSGQAAVTERQILKKLVALPRYSVFDHITFQLNNGTVILGGKVISLGTKNLAEKTLKNMPGVVEVINNIEELPPSGYDDSIRREALSEFTRAGLGPYLNEYDPSVRIIVDRGQLTLEGYVNSKGDWNLLNILGNGVTGVFHVTNNLVVGKDVRR